MNRIEITTGRATHVVGIDVRCRLGEMVSMGRRNGREELGVKSAGLFMTGIGTACWTISSESMLTVSGDCHFDVGGGFQEVTQELFAEGTLDQARVENPTERAEAFCYAFNTLNRAIKMATVVHLNGEESVRRVSEPAS